MALGRCKVRRGIPWCGDLIQATKGIEMIFVTVGTQLPFDRLVEGVDAWAKLNPSVPVVAQVGQSSIRYSYIQTVQNLTQAEFLNNINQAKLVVAHAGMGTILTASELGKPVILMPRRAALREHRNDHQEHTANEMQRLSNVVVVDDKIALFKELDAALGNGFQPSQNSDQETAIELEGLLDSVRQFIWNDGQREQSETLSGQSVST